MRPEIGDTDRQALFFTLETLQSDIQQARASQQAIFQWSTGAVAAVFAGGLVLLSSDRFNRPPTLNSANLLLLVLVFCVGIPSICAFSLVAFLGEVWRMGRASRLQRSVESAVRDVVRFPIGSEPGLVPILLSESYMQLGYSMKGKSYEPRAYYAQLGVFIGSGLFSSLFGCVAVSRFRFHRILGVSEHYLLFVISAALTVALATFTLNQGRQLKQYATETPELEDIDRRIRLRAAARRPVR